MYDALTTRYTFSCPERGQTRVALSSFRRLEQLPGPARPAVFEVDFGCVCGHEHPGLVSHDDLDWAPLGLGGDATFVNLMTATVDPVEPELADLRARRGPGGPRRAAPFGDPAGGAVRPGGAGARRSRRAADPGRRVAVELLLLP